MVRKRSTGIPVPLHQSAESSRETEICLISLARMGSFGPVFEQGLAGRRLAVSACVRLTPMHVRSNYCYSAEVYSAYRPTGAPSMRQTLITPLRSALTMQLLNGVSTTPKAHTAS